MRKWYQVALFNLIVLVILGWLLRYKINFPLPFFKQENVLHAHSHFAFYGWIGFLLQLLVLEGFTNGYHKATIYWNRFFIGSTIINYGMIVSFTLTGYSGISILFSTAALWLTYAYVYKIYKLLITAGDNKLSISFIKASLFFLVISSLGPYALAILIALDVREPYWTHNALYYFLHFQYNGWFTFAVLGFLVKKLETSSVYNYKRGRTFLLLLTASCIPSYFFTSLWHTRPVIITVIIIVAAVLQTAALFYLCGLLYNNAKKVYAHVPQVCRWLYCMAISAFVLKVVLQSFSVYPRLSQLAFGYRPIIIGYLHLIFLAFITMYLIGLLAEKRIIPPGYKVSYAGLITFAAGIMINELLLAIQGLTAIYLMFLPAINLLLYANTFVLMAGAILLFKAARQSGVVHFEFNTAQRDTNSTEVLTL